MQIKLPSLQNLYYHHGAVTFGTDPEFFILDSNGVAVPAHKFFPPKNARTCAGNVSVYRDGFAVEINTEGMTCRGLLTDQVRSALRIARSKLPVGYRLVADPIVPVTPEMFEDAPPDVREFGCDGSIDAYTGNQQFPPTEAKNYAFRSGGGHLHFGTTVRLKNGVFGPFVSKEKNRHQWLENPANHRRFIQMMDLWVGVPLAVLDPDPRNYIRRQTYGRAGEFRNQLYRKKAEYHVIGLEYRTPSAFVVRNHEVFGWALGVGRALFENFKMFNECYPVGNEAAIQAAINTGEKVDQLLCDFPGFHNRDMIHRLAKAKCFDRFRIADYQGNSHVSWGETMHKLFPEYSSVLVGGDDGIADVGYFRNNDDAITLGDNLYGDDEDDYEDND